MAKDNPFDRIVWLRQTLIACLAASLLAGCQSIGSVTVPRDRMDYATAIGESWKQMMLLNIVKQRYLDVPVYLDIDSVISSYSLATTGNIGLTSFPQAQESSNAALGASRSLTESPTISYAPLTGERLVSSLLHPLPPETVIAMIGGGRRADYLLQVTVRSINRLRNASTMSPTAGAADPGFIRVIGAINRIEQAGAFGLAVEPGRERPTTFVVFDPTVESVAEDIRTVKTLLGLDQERNAFRLVTGAGGGDAIALNTRSIQQILGELSTGVQVPAQDIEEERATGRGRTIAGPAPLIEIRAGDEKPDDAYVAVRYRNHWFWVDDRDLASKRMFVFLMMFMSLAETGKPLQGPLLTLPVR
jgi:hypothetical protein